MIGTSGALSGTGLLNRSLMTPQRLAPRLDKASGHSFRANALFPVREKYHESTPATVICANRVPCFRVIGVAKSIRAPSFRGYTPASPRSSMSMRANTKDGGIAERRLRSALFSRRLRFRKNVASLPGRPDIVFVSAGVCVFCDGDFWHGRDWLILAKALAERHNPTYWRAKIATNRQRDSRQSRELRARGWRVIRVWETDVLADVERVAQCVQEVVLTECCRRQGARRPRRPDSSSAS